MRLFGLKNCDTCRKALKSLPDARFIDVRSDGVPEELLVSALDQFGDALLNTRSTTWRGLDQNERAEPPLDLLKKHPTLMKRPLIESHDGQLFLGWTAEVRSALNVDRATTDQARRPMIRSTESGPAPLTTMMSSTVIHSRR
ncbi:arsenate reductase [Sedimentitalea sp. CAU 1593]|uniref:Arsenate reductase n=1 Tax=Sedimentitalea arenosa TaxID=2798803 RepID=A0A8J7IH88_9RHOB|nr:arsenate reductase [Arenibacterium arenosum]